MEVLSVQPNFLDEPDALPENLRFNAFDILCLTCSILSYTADIGADIYLCVEYFRAGELAYFIFTLVFLVLPSCTITGMSLRWYLKDKESPFCPRATLGQWLFRLCFLLLHLGPVVRYVDTIYYGLKSRRALAKGDKAKQRHYYQLCMNEDADATLLRLVESYTESAPQMIVQICIVLRSDRSNHLRLAFQLCSIATSLTSISWAMTTYTRSIRYQHPHKQNITLGGTVVHFMSQICLIGSRIMAIGFFASLYPMWIGPTCGMHWIIMYVWLILQREQTCASPFSEILVSGVFAAMQIFVYFNVTEEPTKKKYIFYYTVTLIENVVFIVAWFFFANLDIVFRFVCLPLNFSLFFCGMSLLIVYYMKLHPENPSISEDFWDSVKFKRNCDDTTEMPKRERNPMLGPTRV